LVVIIIIIIIIIYRINVYVKRAIRCRRFVLSEVDFERRSVYSYRVVASDAGQPRRSAASLLDIQILDVDDELPRFQTTEYHFQVITKLL